jgi:GNAT superfamily N-acetyltransferase
MVFWTIAPQYSIQAPFSSHVIEKDIIPSPIGNAAIHITRATATPELVTEICTYVRTYFGNPPHTPVLDIPESCLLLEHDYLFLIRDKEGKIAGTIRYRYTGELLVDTSSAICPSIYRVDAFCIRPDWRKKGVGDYLLTELQHYATTNGQPYAMFLKEGPYLSITHVPLYSSTYVYRDIQATQVTQVTHVRQCSSAQAYHMLVVYHRMYPNICIIRNQHGNQHWRYYKQGYSTILACFQDTYQRLEGKKIAWCTAWLESSVVTDEIRMEAAIELTNTLPSFDYVWMNRRWVGNHSAWKQDGGFHWYTYQWSTNCILDVSMCILD